MSRGTYSGDRAWADRYTPQVKDILLENLRYIATFAPAPRNKDIACIGDFMIAIDTADILCRIRATAHRDFTLRAWRRSKVDTEVQKIVEGAGRWYFYGWLERDGGAIAEWMIVDLNVLRTTDIIETKMQSTIANKDAETAFIAIPRALLEHIGAVVVQEKHGAIRSAYGQRYTSDESDIWLYENGYTRNSSGGWVAPDGQVF